MSAESIAPPITAAKCAAPPGPALSALTSGRMDFGGGGRQHVRHYNNPREGGAGQLLILPYKITA